MKNIFPAKRNLGILGDIYTAYIFTMSTVLTIYASLIYTAPCLMLLMRAATISWACGRGLGP
jgi:hypothetical protein